MSTAEVATHTPDDLLAMPDGGAYELVNGQLVERRMSEESSWVAGEVYGRLREIVRGSNLGWVFPEGTGYQCFREDPGRVRKPDASFVRRDQLPDGPVGTGYTRVPPDLAVEVVSPHDLAYEVENKIEEWLAAGVRQVWLVMPPARTVTVYVPGVDPRRFRADETLTSPELFPGFECRVGDLFPVAAKP